MDINNLRKISAIRQQEKQEELQEIKNRTTQKYLKKIIKQAERKANDGKQGMFFDLDFNKTDKELLKNKLESMGYYVEYLERNFITYVDIGIFNFGIRRIRREAIFVSWEDIPTWQIPIIFDTDTRNNIRKYVVPVGCV